MSNRSRFSFRRMNRSLVDIAQEEGFTSANILGSFTQYADPIYGTGSDGDATISSNTTLTADMYYNNLTVNANVVLNTGGYRLFVKNLLQLGNGSVVGFTTGSSASGTIGGGGTLLEAVTNSLGGASATLSATLPAASVGGAKYYYQPHNAIRGWAVSASQTSPLFLRGGAGGVGQAGGGIVIVAARYIASSATTTNAKIAAPATPPGGGGVVIVISSAAQLPANVSTDVTGQNAGTSIYIRVS